MDVKELNYDFNIDMLYLECYNIIDKVKLHEYHNQISLKHTDKDIGNPWYQGCGSLKYKFGENFIKDGELVEQEIKLDQTDFTVLNKQLENTYLQKVHDELAKDYKFGRMRIMALPHKKCMSMHTDSGKRIHIPIETNENCLMIIDNKVHHMPANGKAYLVDVSKPHTALNANHNFLRLHLLFDLI